MGANFDLRKEREERKKANRRKKFKDGDDMTETESQDSSDDKVTENRIGLSDDELTNIFKDYELYLAAKNGNLNNFENVLDQVSATKSISYRDILSRVSPAGNTFLHVATIHGHEGIVTYIAAQDLSLVLKKNFNGDTALHLAAKAGNASMVERLVSIHRNLLAQGQGQADSNNLLRAKDERENTAFHEALINDKEFVPRYLIQEDPELANYQNKQKEYGLYLAAKAGFAECVYSILTFLTDDECINDQFKKKSPIKVAIVNKKRRVLEAIFNWNPLFINLRDCLGRTPLHYAALSGSLEEVRYLLNEHRANVFERDKQGLLPIHMASAGGHVDIIGLMIKRCPDPTELIDNNGGNILHCAAGSGRLNVVRYILNNPGLSELINMKDKQGNVPLHLATVEWHPRIVSALTWDKRANVKLVNNQGMTALDAANNNTSYDPSFRELLTWTALKAAGTPITRSFTNVGGQRSKRRSKVIVHTLLLVSTIIATVTFAAGFTLPGGYNNSNPDVGMAALLRKKGFHVFVLCDAIAMYSSMVVAIALIWAQLGHLDLTLTALSLALPLLCIAIGMMSMAFAAGIFLVVTKLNWLSTAVLVMGFTFLVIQLVLFAPLLLSLTSRNPLLRRLSYYPFCFLTYATRCQHTSCISKKKRSAVNNQAL